MTTGGQDMNRMIDNVAAGYNMAAPVWVPIVSQLNVALTFISLVAGLVFMVWRAHREAKRPLKDRDDG